MKKFLIAVGIIGLLFSGCSSFTTGGDPVETEENQGEMQLDKFDRNAIEAALFFHKYSERLDEKQLGTITKPEVIQKIKEDVKNRSLETGLPIVDKNYEIPRTTEIELYPFITNDNKVLENVYIVNIMTPAVAGTKISHYQMVYWENDQWWVEPIEYSKGEAVTQGIPPKKTSYPWNTRDVN